jgi:hypothetical protein
MSDQLKMYGVRIKRKSSEHVMTFWFENPEEMERQINMFHPDEFEIDEYLHEQQELIFDIPE